MDEPSLPPRGPDPPAPLPLRDPPPVPLPDHRPPQTPAGGCAKVLGIGCGGFLVLALAAITLLFFNMGPVVTFLQRDFVEKVLERSEAPEPVKAQVGAVIDEYDAIRKKEDLGFGEWKKVSQAFSRSPAFMVLGILDARAGLRSVGLSPEVDQRASRTLERLMRGVVEGKVSADDLVALVERSRAAPSPGEKPRAVDVKDIGREELLRFLPEAETLLDERGVAGDPFTPDLPALLRRDLRASLESGKRAGE